MSKEIVIVGPRLDSVSHASHAPIAIAARGITQIMDGRFERFVAARAGGRVVVPSLMTALWANRSHP